MKKMSTLLTALLLTTLSLVSQAQTKNVKISGRVEDASKTGVAAATVSLLKSTDSSLVKVTMSDKEGRYAFEGIAAGSFLVKVSAIGFAEAFSGIIATKDGLSAEVAPVQLQIASKELKAFTVAGRKPLIEQKIDRTVINVDAAVTNVGASALEVLEKSPGVTVDKDGTISLKGKQSVQVFVDGKPSYLSGEQLVNLLKNMNANQLEQIEIMTNPPAKYDAAGNSGIINIKTKKNKQKGFNGSISATYAQGVYGRTNESLNLNYRNGKINSFLNYGYNYNESFQELGIERFYKESDGKTISASFDQVAFMPRQNNNHNLKFGMDYFASKKTTIGFVASGFNNLDKNQNYNTSNLRNGIGVLDSMVYSTSFMNNKWKNGSMNLNLRHQFDSTGRELTVDFDYSRYDSKNSQEFINTSYTSNWVEKNKYLLNSQTPIDISIYSGKLDYTHPLKKDAKLEAGLKTSYVETDNKAIYTTLQNGSWIPDYSKSNHFDYKENINAAYVNFNKQFGKLGVQAGLRAENTNLSGHQLGNPVNPDSSFKRSYTSVFPTAFISYNADSSNQFALSVGRRIDRASYQDMNPFLFYIDNYTYEAGNPYIRPQYTMNYEVSHTYNNFLVTTINYSNTLDMMTETFEQKGYATIVRQGNIGRRKNAGISISAQIPVVKWWSASVYTNYNYSRFEGKLYGEDINVEGANLLVNINNQFRFNKGWSAELSGFYRTKGVEGQILINPLGQASAGVSKQVMKGKGSLRLSIRDMFYTNKVKGSIHFQQTDAYFWNKRDSRVASISFTYRFGKPLKAAGSSKRNSGAEEEQNRVKVGGSN